MIDSFSSLRETGDFREQRRVLILSLLMTGQEENIVKCLTDGLSMLFSIHVTIENRYIIGIDE